MLKRAVARFELDTGMSVDMQATMNGIKQFSYSTPSLEAMVKGQQMRRGNMHGLEIDEPLSDDDPVDALDIDGLDIDENEDEFDEEVSKPRQLAGKANTSNPYDKNDNFASSAPVLIGTPSRGIRRHEEDEFEGAESYYGSALHKEHLRQSLQKNN
ncbi:Oidioi.mRNA.OKI2018_I69.chr2.g6721.t1.cds [Oikopleura dioica]|uniref:Oidioi.mRNA.OKI2018_I69.chr2.g6721.t1.cds n=1 Tax=Oikopleura dioica TaxID=34765 RepID=A0ABN7TAH4_OIKDI|nr:Oidioi.mRNA.OKI2018_I69.chr2.g6721.t1.cds [Oikopleura dioica]